MNTIVSAPPSSKSTDDYIADMAGWTADQLEALVRSYQGRDPFSLSDEDLKRGLAALRIHRRTTAGPPKTKASAKVTMTDLL